MKEKLDLEIVMPKNVAWWMQTFEHLPAGVLWERHNVEEDEVYKGSMDLRGDKIPALDIIIKACPGKTEEERGHIEMTVKLSSLYNAGDITLYENKNMTYKDLFKPFTIRNVDFTKMDLRSYVYNLYPDIVGTRFDLNCKVFVRDHIQKKPFMSFYEDAKRKEKKEATNKKEEVQSVKAVSKAREYRRKSNYLRR